MALNLNDDAGHRGRRQCALRPAVVRGGVGPHQPSRQRIWSVGAEYPRELISRRLMATTTVKTLEVTIFPSTAMLVGGSVCLLGL